ncbi:hypothetical protein SDC9_13774 [bioreactor metagenome]|uniref:Glycosyl transferase family 25 domain-containing protein n=1 Tax=bioreactor metagenome TaxID=1076179 RepID=A0A644TQU5_9ZZZZ|nr:glycosyltransferase family 25 protein [Negativicutes bacterium]
MNDYAFFIMHYKKNIERRNYIFENFVTNDKSIRWITDYDREQIDDSLDDLYCFNHDNWYEIVGQQLPILVAHRFGLNPNYRKTPWTPLIRRIEEIIRQNTPEKVIQEFPQFMPRKLKTFEISLLLKHRAAFKDIVANHYKFGIILEDDFILKETSLTALKNLISCGITDWDFIDLAGGAELTPREQDKEVIPGLFSMLPPRTRTTCGYMISNRLCREITNLDPPLTAPCDWELTYFLQRFQAKAFWTMPTLINHGSEMKFYQSNNN